MNDVIKRDGRIVAYDEDKIYEAIIAARDSVGELCLVSNEDIQLIVEYVERDLEELNSPIDIEYIQDRIEYYLKIEYPQIYESYHNYRKSRQIARAFKDPIFEDGILRLINPKLKNEKQNANMNEESFTGRASMVGDSVMKRIALDYLIDEDLAQAHLNGEIYIHDLNNYASGTSNCLTMDIASCLKTGYKTNNGQLRPPQGFNTACQQMAIIMQCQSSVQFGGVAEPHFDKTMAPYAELTYKKIIDKAIKYFEISNSAEELYNPFNKVKLPKKVVEYIQDTFQTEMRQGAEALIHNLNSLESRAASQLPFTSINLGLDTSFFGRQCSIALLNAHLNGIGPLHLTPTFPILVFQIKRGINLNPEEPNYDIKQLAIKVAAKRMTPNFVNCDSILTGTVKSDNDIPTTMGW